jgi:hypothetical protein
MSSIGIGFLCFTPSSSGKQTLEKALRQSNPCSCIVSVMPILLPIGQELGFDPLHFGVFVVTALSVEFITPPIGINLFAAFALSEQPFLGIVSKMIPAFLAPVITVSIIAFFLMPFFGFDSLKQFFNFLLWRQIPI